MKCQWCDSANSSRTTVIGVRKLRTCKRCHDALTEAQAFVEADNLIRGRCVLLGCNRMALHDWHYAKDGMGPFCSDLCRRRYEGRR